MTPPMPLTAIAAGFLLAGTALVARSLWRLAAAVRARLTYGAPYHRGQIGERAFATLLTLPIALLGAGMLVIALGQAAFQPVRPVEAIRVGQMEFAKAGWGRITVRLTPDPAYPEGRVLEGAVEGARWAVVGDFLDWDPGVRWLGLVPAHRVRGLAGTGDVSGGAITAARTVPIDAPPRMARRLLAWDRFLPMLRVRIGSTAWMPPSERAVAILYVTPEGYITDRAALP
jgi:hypothetical protein